MIYNTKQTKRLITERIEIANVYIDSRGFLNSNITPSTNENKLLLVMYMRYPELFELLDGSLNDSLNILQKLSIDSVDYLVTYHLKLLNEEQIHSLLYGDYIDKIKRKCNIIPIYYRRHSIVIYNAYRYLVVLLHYIDTIHDKTYGDDNTLVPFNSKYVDVGNSYIDECGFHVFDYKTHPYGYTRNMRIVKNNDDLIEAIKHSYNNIYIDGDVSISLYDIMNNNKIYRNYEDNENNSEIYNDNENNITHNNEDDVTSNNVDGGSDKDNMTNDNKIHYSEDDRNDGNKAHYEKDDKKDDINIDSKTYHNEIHNTKNNNIINSNSTDNIKIQNNESDINVYGNKKLQTIEDINPSYFKTWAIGPNCTRLEYLFNKYPFQPQVEHWVLNNIQSCLKLFCKSGVIDLSKWTILYCHSAKCMFMHCKKLVRLPSFYSVKECTNICEGCIKLNSVDGVFLNSQLLIKLESAFRDCVLLKHVFNDMTFTFENADETFSGCTNLETAFNNCNFNSNKAFGINMSYLFYNCPKLKMVLNNCTFKFKSIQMIKICDKCPSLTHILNDCNFIQSESHFFNNSPCAKFKCIAINNQVLKVGFRNCIFKSMSECKLEIQFIDLFPKCSNIRKIFDNCKCENVIGCVDKKDNIIDEIDIEYVK